MHFLASSQVAGNLQQICHLFSGMAQKVRAIVHPSLSGRMNQS
jgi:hypothetical protein